MPSRILKILYSILPKYSDLIYKAARRYVDNFSGDNNSNFFTNGESRFLDSALPGIPRGVIFDIGANIGDWSRYCLSIVPSAQLHMFEPSVFTYRKLADHSWPKQVKLNNFGLGERIENLKLRIVKDGSGMNSLYERHFVLDQMCAESEDIHITTIDAYCLQFGIENIDLVKIDVEGHELSVLIGASQMLSEGRISMIQFEYGGCYLDSRVFLRDIWSLLAGYGFTLGKIYSDGIRYFEKYQPELENFSYSNWIAKK